MKRRALWATWILFLAPVAITEAAAQPASERVDPGELEDRTVQRDPRACSQSKIDEVLARPRITVLDDRNVVIDCNLTLKSTDVVTKTLMMSGQPADGVSVNCNGAKIVGKHWSDKEAIVVQTGGNHGPENVTVRNCTVEGRVRVGGYGGGTVNQPNHTQLIQARSPKNIVFDGMNITAHGADPFYVFSGTLRVTLMNSRIRGSSHGPAVYFDAESAENVLKDNEFDVKTDGREQIAIDGSARNLIVGNRLSGLNNGGIFIYRNCGEGGSIRHQFPADNVILDNIFYYRNYNGFRPAVWIASRQNNLPGYCDEDRNGPKLGSNLDNLDHAYRTVAAHNRFIGRDPVASTTVFGAQTVRELIRVDDDPSYVFGNVRDDQARNRNSSCYVANGYPTPIVAHGKSIAMFDDGSGPRCTGRRLTCNDGRLTPGRANCSTELASRLSVVPFQCRADRNNRGCNSRAACPRGTSVVAIKAACDLEDGRVTDEEFSKTPWSFAGVVRRSDKASDGVCAIGSIDVSERGAVLGAPRASQIPFSCREHDDNGGDCHVRGALACAARPVFEN